LAQPNGPADAGSDQFDREADAGQAANPPTADVGPRPPDGSETGVEPDALEAAESGRAQVISQAEEGQPAFLQGTVNQVNIGDVLVVVRPRDVLVKVVDLQSGGVHVQDGKRGKRGEDLFVSLRSLAPKITYVFDEANLNLAITADPSLFGASVLDLRPKRPEGIIYDTSRACSPTTP